MPVFALSDKLNFPRPDMAEKDGLLAIGGDLSPERLILAYSQGIFPWFSEGDPIMWWSPDPRMVLFPDKFRLYKSLKQTLQNKPYTIQFDSAFEEVIKACRAIERTDQDGTWITEEMEQAYIHLHRLGYAHSVETYFEDKLAGGLYGISLGRAFFGESMFYYQKDASKIALYALVQKLTEWNFHFIDAQVETNHLRTLGAELIPRKEFLSLLREALNYPTIKGKW
jgi:leucyl/phenylalanyl-tRNA--protein transferase